MREVSGRPVASETEEQERFVANAIPALVAYLDTGCCYVWANEAHRRWFGHPPERLRGLHLREVLGATTWESVRPHVERVLAGEEVSFDHRIVAANGPPRDVRAFYTPHRDAGGRVLGFVGMLHEIARPPGVDEALRRSEHMLERSQSSAHVGSWEVTLVDHEGGRAGAVQWSDETYRLLGFEPGAVEITDAGFLDYMHPDERQPLCDEWTVHIQRGESFESDFRIFRPDGTVRLLHTWTDFERDAQGRPTHMVGTCQDVTERKRAERELLEADRRKDEFLAMLSHELRNPLAPILNAVEILHDAKPDDQELAVKYRAIIARQVRHMERLLDDLLDVSRVSQGKIQLQRRPIELGALLLEAVEISRPLITEKRQQLSLALAQDLLPMDADPTRLLQVFANLLNNAAKYTDARGHITLAVTVEDGEAVVKVRDDGTGMTPELLARVFDLFVQETRSLDRAQGGLGIGLTMVRTLVRCMAGRCARSATGRAGAVNSWCACRWRRRHRRARRRAKHRHRRRSTPPRCAR